MYYIIYIYIYLYYYILLYYIIMPPVVGYTVGVGGNQRVVWGVVPKALALSVMLSAAAGDLLLLLK